ncbi:MAG: HAMP domain-containing histidine kinase [Dehalococcoidia bacterium]|nr:HAMP domain-containing histidine kinase [Dehalococcoidia bacterium]
MAFAMLAHLRASARASEVAQMSAPQQANHRELASMAHDLKGPLSTVASYLDLIAEGALGPVSDDTRAAVQRAGAASAQARTLVESALLQHVESTATHPPTINVANPVDLRALIRDVTEALRVEIAASNAEVTVEPLPRVIGDEAQLFRMFQNLVQNAVKYARPGETPIVTITGASAYGRAEIAVRDHGIGIPAEDRELVFEATARASNGQLVAPGHGLGLAIVRRLVHDLGGEVWVDATSRDGATGRLSLPLAA